MTKHRNRITERIQWQAENSPRFHRIVLEAGMYMTHLLAIARGTLVISGGTASGTVTGENPGNLFAQTLKLNATPAAGSGYPGGQLVNCSPRTLLQRRIFDRGFYQGDTALTGAAGTFTVNLNIPVQFALPRLVRPFDTALRLDAYADLQLEITNGGRDRQWTGNDRVFDYSGMVWDIIEYREFAPGTPTMVLYQDDKIIPINQANARFPIFDQLQQPEAFLDLLFQAETTNQALSDAIINKVEILAGSEQFIELDEDHVKDDQLAFVSSAAQAAAMTGLYYVPISPKLLAGAQGGISAVLDVSKPGTDQLRLGTRRIARPAKAA